MIDQVYQYIDEHREEIIQSLIDICKIKSVSDDKSEIQPFGQGCKDVLDAMLIKGKKENFKTVNHEYYVGSITLNTGNKENIGILAHLDVVPEGPLEYWKNDPYQPEIRDGFLFGRGVGDDKSGAIAGLYIQKAIRDLKIPMKHNIELLLGTNEETGMKDMEYYCEHYQAPAFTFVPDAGFPGVCGEFGRLRYNLSSKKKLSEDIVDFYAGTVFNVIPNKATIIFKKNTNISLASLPDDFEIKESARGIEVTAFGVSSHAAGPERGVNAIKVLTKELVKLQGMKDEDLKIIRFIDSVNEDCYGTFLGIANKDEVSGQTVSSGTVLRNVDGIITLTNDCRYCVTDSNTRLLNNITSLCDQYDFKVAVLEDSKPYHLDPNGPIIQVIQKEYTKYTGKTKEIRIGKGGTYAGKIPNGFATGAVLVDYENRRIPEGLEAGQGGAHQPNEFIDLDAYIDGIKLLASMVLSVDQVL